MKLAIIDLDGALADSSARNKTAHSIALEKLSQSYEYVLPEDINRLKAMKEYKAAFYADDAFYDPDFVALDTLIEGAKEALDVLIDEGYRLIYLTSRPELMRLATLAWLGDHDILHYVDGNSQGVDMIDLVMKPTAFQYVKTPVWKAGTVQMLASLYGASEVLFVDDEEANRNAVMDVWMSQGDGRELIVASSLQDVLEKLKEEERR